MTHYSNTSNPVDFPKLTTIDRLWGEALDRAVPDTYSSLSWEQVERIKSVFAELIVRECVEQIIIRKRRDGEWYQDDLFKHFGVEE
jgi:hypothetical protein